ncbi:MAG: nucleoside-diphosphate-sugar epimerase [Alphaproteobacteria bacterium]|jgi:nucleoside-diphosphate-sugar epimerase
MRILITGAGGFIGAHMVNACLDNGHQVVANFRADSIAHSAPTERARVELLRCDLNELTRLPENIDAVIHAAGVRESAPNADERCFFDNELATRRLARRACAAGVANFVHFSSIAVTDAQDTLFVNEATPPRPRGVYGASKLASERHLAASGPGLKRLIIRLPGVLGAGAHGGFLPSLARDIHAGAPVHLFNARRPFNRAVHIDALTALVLRALENHSIRYDTIVLGAAGRAELGPSVEAMIDAAQSKSTIIEGDSGPPAPLIDFSAATRRFHYRPADLPTMLAHYMANEHRSGGLPA